MSDPDLQNPKQMKSGQARHERPIWIWDCDTAGFVWANGEGVKFWSAHSLERLQAMPFDKSHPAWVAINLALESDVPLRGVDLDLHFPNGNGGMDCMAICRWGTLKNRRAIIVELLGMSATEDELLNGYKHAGAGLSEFDDNPHNDDTYYDDVTFEDDAFLPGMEVSTARNEPKEDKSNFNRDLESALKTETSSPYSIHVPINGHDIAAKDEFEGDDDLTEGDVNSAYHRYDEIYHHEGGHEDIGELGMPQDVSETAISISDNSSVPLEQLHELAKLIKQAGGTTDDVMQAAELHKRDVQITGNKLLRLEEDDAENQKPTNEHAENAEWGSPDLDMIALAGVGDQDELELILNNSAEPVALISLQKMLHANPHFVAEFGYGDISTLVKDGSDLLFPNSRNIFKQAIENPARVVGGDKTQQIEVIRLRSGRKLKRVVVFKPIKLTKFDRTLLLLRLEGEFQSDDEPQTTGVPVSSIAAAGRSSDPYSISMMNAVNHEVRTPLNVIIGFSELMIREQFGPVGHEKYQGYVKDIYTSAQHALSLINDLLDLTKLQAGKWVIERQEVDINEVARQQVRLMRELAAKAGVRFYSELEENLPLILADERALKQILLNLISNAIKYNRENGRITVATERLDKKTVRLRVSDTGTGMTAPNITKALQPFQQVLDEKTSDSCAHSAARSVTDNPDRYNHKGTGLGLPIAKALAEANDMTFRIESEVGTGTKITLLMKVES